MIRPQVNEEEWVQALDGLTEWEPPAMRTVVVAPHPDDETLGAGGLIAAQRRRGCEVIVVCVTDGENAYPGEDSEALAAVRREEQRAALERLGAGAEGIVRLGLVDSAVSAQEGELVNRLIEVVSKETLLVAPWEGDFHPDHEACGRAALEVAERTGATLASYFFWTWHRGQPEQLEDLRLVSLRLDDEMLRAKTEALAMHRSQLVREGGEAILPEELLGPVRRGFEVFAVR